MKLSRIPFIFVLFSFFLTIPAAYTQFKLLTYLSDAGIISIFIYSIFYKNNFNLTKSYLYKIVLPIILFYCTYLIRGLSFPSKGTLLLILISYIYFTFIKTEKDSYQPVKLFSQMQFIYIFLIGALLLETILRLGGFDSIFVPFSNITHSSPAVKIYKFYNTAYLFNAIGFKDMTGLNSLLMGSQAASQIIANAIIIYLPLYFNSKIKLISNRTLIAFVSLLFYPFVATLTSNIIILSILLILLFTLPNSKLNNRKYRLFSLFILLISQPFYYLLIFRIDNISDFQTYLVSFLDPIYAFIDLPLISKLFGTGDLSVFVDQNPVAGDFGFGVLTVSMGLIPIIFLLLTFYNIFRSTIKKINEAIRLGYLNHPWIYLAGINILCTTAWLISLIHYTQALELGGRQIFAFHLSISVIALIRIKEDIINKKIVTTKRIDKYNF